MNDLRMESLVTLDHISFQYPETSHVLLEDFNLSIKRGELLVIVGMSGIGKSSVLRLVCSLLQPQKGTIRLQALPEENLRPFGFVFQDIRLYPWRRVIRNVTFGLEGLPMSREERITRAMRSLSLTGLQSFARRWPDQLSGGQKQRVGIARALAVNPALLLMDEPFSSLDSITRIKLQQELINIWEKTRTSILFVTHDIREALLLADRIVVLSGTPARIITEYSISLERTARAYSSEIDELFHDIQRKLHMKNGSSS